MKRYGDIITDRKGPAFLIAIDRPEHRNALGEDIIESFHEALDDAATTPCVVVLCSHAPGMFVSGTDIAELRDRTADDGFRAVTSNLCDHLESHRWPTIAAIDGPALGAGCELALACDFRVASPRALFGQPEPNLGLIAGAGANWRLAQLAGLPVARRILLMGSMLSSEEAADVGLVDAVVEEDQVVPTAIEMAEKIAKRSWRALELTKLALRLHRPATAIFDMAAQAIMLQSDDKYERTTAFLDRRRTAHGSKEVPSSRSAK